MNREQHTPTPGPWARHSSFPELIVPAAHTRRPVGFSINEEENQRFALQIARLHRDETNEADARLIAAAPTMRAALKDVLDVDGWEDPYHETGITKEERHAEMLAQVHAAIALATGTDR